MSLCLWDLCLKRLTRSGVFVTHLARHAKTALPECATRVSHKSVLQDCVTRVSYKECPGTVSQDNVHNVLQECGRVASKIWLWVKTRSLISGKLTSQEVNQNLLIQPHLTACVCVCVCIRVCFRLFCVSTGGSVSRSAVSSRWTCQVHTVGSLL